LIYICRKDRGYQLFILWYKKSHANDIKEKLKLVRGTQVTKNKIQRAVNTIQNFYIDKGYLDVQVEVVQKNDTALNNHVIVGLTLIRMSEGR
jgi:outer membrane protein insertion porin family